MLIRQYCLRAAKLRPFSNSHCSVSSRQCVLPKAVRVAGDIVALGDGRVGGNIQEFSLQVGQTVVYSKFGIGSTDVDIQGQRHTMLREDDCIGIMPKSNATASDIPQLKPVGDRVLIKASIFCDSQLIQSTCQTDMSAAQVDIAAKDSAKACLE